MAIERYLPKSNRGYNPWFKVKDSTGKEGDYYIPGEDCDPVGYEWFWKEDDKLRPVNELLGMRLIAKERKTNLLLDVPPDYTGRIPKATVDKFVITSYSIHYTKLYDSPIIGMIADRHFAGQKVLTLLNFFTAVLLVMAGLTGSSGWLFIILLVAMLCHMLV